MSTGHMVTSSLFWSLVSAALSNEDHRDHGAQKMILACLGFVCQRPEDYVRYLVKNNIRPPGSLRRGVHKMQKRAPSRKGGTKANLAAGGNTLKHSASQISCSGDGLAARQTLGSPSGSDMSEDVSDTMSVMSGVSRDTNLLAFFKEPVSVRIPR